MYLFKDGQITPAYLELLLQKQSAELLTQLSQGSPNAGSLAEDIDNLDIRIRSLERIGPVKMKAYKPHQKPFPTKKKRRR